MFLLHSDPTKRSILIGVFLIRYNDNSALANFCEPPRRSMIDELQDDGDSTERKAEERQETLIARPGFASCSNAQCQHKAQIPLGST